MKISVPILEGLSDIFPKMGAKSSIKRIVVLTGAGMSAESGLRTFRDHGGLWEEHSIYDVATPEAWLRDQQLVLKFYNQRRKQLLDCAPNLAHDSLVELEKKFEISIVTQNIDDLHERAGSRNVLHLHGELRKARSSGREDLVYNIDGWELKEGDCCEEGHQLRPHVVWFGEAVPMMPRAEKVVRAADLVIVIGTSLSVYPAAGLVHATKPDVPIILVDPGNPEVNYSSNIYHLRKPAGEGVPQLTELLMSLDQA